MKNILILLTLVLSPWTLSVVNAQVEKVKWINIEPTIGFTYLAITDTTLQRNTKSYLSLTFNPRVNFYVNQQFECGIQGIFTRARSDFPENESGEAYGFGYQGRYHFKKLAFKETIIAAKVKYVFSIYPYLGFEHNFSTAYHNAQGKQYFSNRLQTQNLAIAAGLHLYIWRQLYLNFALGMGYTPDLKDKNFYGYSVLSFGYTFQKYSKTKNKNEKISLDSSITH